jgi:putative hydrolase
MNLGIDGSGDMEPGDLDALDLVVGSFHSKLRLTEDQTERYVAAVRNPAVHILGHPRGRQFNFRTGLHADWKRVFEAAAEHRTAVEINSNPNRQDLNDELAALAAGSGALISIGTDAHSVGELDYAPVGAAVAIRSGIPAEQILNCWDADRLLAWVAGEGR